MEKWELAAREFIDLCDFKADIETVFLTGSRATGNADGFSDIDLLIVLNDTVDWRQRGNKRVDGYLVEYFANPMRQIKRYIDAGYDNVRLTDINMILGGNVIYGGCSTANELIEYCRQKLMAPFPNMDEFKIKTGLYILWNNFDELSRACAYHAPDFTMHFYKFTQYAFELYSRYTRSPVPSYHNLHRWLTDDDYFNNYGLAAHNDPEFIKIIKIVFDCLDTKSMHDLSKTVYTYVANKMGGFDIDNFVLRSKCD